MKKFIFCVFISFWIAPVTSQVNPHAIGVRGGAGNYGRGGEVSYQHGLGNANRLEFDLGWRGDRVKGFGYNRHVAIYGIYHWVWNLKDGLNWFAGPGAAIGIWNGYDKDIDNGITIGVGGQIGMEYDFNQHKVPLILGIDTRPMWGLFGGYSGFGFGGAFSLRYTL